MTVFMLAMLVVATLIIGGVIDFMSLVNQKQTVQDVADRTAVAAARELVIAKGTKERVQSVSERYLVANYSGAGAKVNAEIVENGRAVKVDVSADPQVYFPGPVGRNAKRVKASATAEIAGGGNVCMIGLDKSLPWTLDMKDKARLTAVDCAIYSNSTSNKSFKVHDSAKVKAELVCVGGGVDGPKTAIQPEAITDCPPITDPLRDRPMPDIGLLHCDYLATVVITKVTLKPGTYCGGITVALTGVATLEPGMYIINNGALAVTANGTLKGDNVGFFLKGASSTILFTPNTHISLTAPKTGPMAGILFFEDRNTILATYHQISSNDARRLVGTIYIPKSKLMIDATSPVFDKSEYTIIIAREFELKDGPELVLKTDYESSPIPVPDGVGNKAEPRIKLIN